MKRTPTKKKPVKKVISYRTIQNGKSGYLIFATYVIYTGNAINDVKRKFQETIVCDTQEKLIKLEKRFDNSARFVEERLLVEFRRIGANALVTTTEISKLWQH